MRTPNNPLVVDEDATLNPFTGKYSAESNYALMGSRANTLLREAFDFIADMEKLTGFGDNNTEYKNWMEKVRNYSAQRKVFIQQGKDFE